MTKYVAMVNSPGYLPECEPVEFDNPFDAWRYLQDELELDWGMAETYGVEEPSYLEAQNWLHFHDRSQPGSFLANGLAYSVEVVE